MGLLDRESSGKRKNRDMRRHGEETGVQDGREVKSHEAEHRVI